MAQNVDPAKEDVCHPFSLHQKKSCSLPVFGPRGIDHRAIFAALAEEEERRRSSGKHDEDTFHQSKLADDDGSSLEESSISSDTSCSSVEFRRPEDWPNAIGNVPNKESENFVKEQHHLPGVNGVNAQQNDLRSPGVLVPRNSLSKPAHNDHLNSDSENSAKSRSDRSSNAPKGSIESIARKVRLEALKARIVAQREMYKDSSSDNDDEEPAKISRHHSDEYLHRPSRQERKRPGRTERFLKRRSQDEQGLKKSLNHNRQGVCYVDTGGVKHIDVTSGKPPVSGHHSCQSPSTEEHLESDNCKTSINGSQSSKVNCAARSGTRNGQGVYQSSGRLSPSSLLDTSHLGNLDCLNGITGARQRLSVSSAPSGSPPPFSSANSRALNLQQHKLKFLSEDHDVSPTKRLTVSTNLPSVPVPNRVTQDILPQPSPNDSGVSCQSVTASPVFGRAPTPPPRGSQPKMGISQLYHGNSRFLQNQRTLSSSLDTVQDSGRHSHSSTLTLLSETSSDTTSPHQRIPPDMPEPQSKPVKSNSKTAFGKIVIEPSKTSEVPKRPRPSPIYSGSGSSVSVIGYMSRLGAPVYSYTDQAPSNKNDLGQPPSSTDTSKENLNSNLQDSAPKDSDSVADIPILSDSKKENEAVWRRITALYTKPQSQPYRNQSNLKVRSPSASSILQGQKCADGPSQYDATQVGKKPSRPSSLISEKSRSQLSGSSLGDTNLAPVPPVRKHLSSSSLSLDTAKQQMDTAIKKEQAKRTSANFEEALQELEQIYQSLKLNDEDLLDKAERRDLPSKFQWKRNDADSAKNNSERSPKTENFRVTAHRNSVSYPLGRSLSSDCCNFNSRRRASINEDDLILFHHSPPARTPPYRRSGVPDKLADDLAFRKLQKSTSKPTSPSHQQKTISYLQCSPVFTPTLDVEEIFREIQPQPDLEKDDLSYRKYTQAEGARVSPAHPPFGIPVGVVGRSSPSDYLHAPPKEPPKPAFRPRHVHDLVRDDMAYRNLRRDSKNGVPEMIFPEVDANFTNGIKSTFSANKKKQRAERSLSANIAQIIGEKDDKPISLEFERAQSMSDIIAALEVESRKWKNIETSALLGNNRFKKFVNPCKENGILSSIKEANRINKIKSQKSKDSDSLTSTETLTASQGNVNGVLSNRHDTSVKSPTRLDMKESPRIMQDIWRIRAMAAMPSGGRPQTRPRSGSVSSTNEYIKFPRPPAHSPSLPALVKSPPPPIPTRRSAFLAKTLNHDTSSDTERSVNSESNVISPLDEKQLDDLLSSLALDAKECARRTEELLSMSDCLSRDSSAPEGHLTDDISAGSLSGETLHDVSVSA